MVDKALTAIQRTGLFPTAILEWNGFTEENQNWPDFKSYFQEGYELYLQSDRFNDNNPYHGVVNAFTDGNGSIEEINESITNIHHAHNTNTEATSAEMVVLESEVAATRQAMVATQQQMALMAQGTQQMPAPPSPAWPPSYHGAYQQHGMAQLALLATVPKSACAAIPPPAYQPAAQAPPAYQPATAYVPPARGGAGQAYRGRGQGAGRGG